MSWTRSYAEVVPVLREHITGLRHALRTVVPGDKIAAWQGNDGPAQLYEYINLHKSDADFYVALLNAFANEKISWLLQEKSGLPSLENQSLSIGNKRKTSSSNELGALKQQRSEVASTNSTSLICPQPIQLVAIDDHSKLSLSLAGRTLLMRLRQKLAIVSIVGQYRSGKSFLMNRILGQQQGFKTSPGTQGTTKGIWVWGRDLPDGKTLLVLDTEGLFEPGKPAQVDSSIFVLSIFASSLLLFNTQNDIDEFSLEKFAQVSKFAESIQFEGHKNGSSISDHFPDLWWLVRNFQRQHEPGVDDNSYLENCLRIVGDPSNASNCVRSAITTLFPRRRCICLDTPAYNKKLLQDLEQVTNDALEPEFCQKLEALVSAVHSLVPTKIIKSPTDSSTIPLNGNSFLVLLENCITSLNQRKAPLIGSLWDVTARVCCEQALSDAVSSFQSFFAPLLARLPTDERVLQDTKEQAHKVALLEYERSAVGLEKVTLQGELLGRLESYFGEFQRQNYKKSKETCKSVLQELIEELEARIHGNCRAHLRIASIDQLNQSVGRLQQAYFTKTLGVAQRKVWQSAVDILRRIQDTAKLSLQVNDLQTQVEQLQEVRELVTHPQHQERVETSEEPGRFENFMWRRRIRCGGKTKKGKPCRTPIGEGYSRCVWHADQ